MKLHYSYPLFALAIAAGVARAEDAADQAPWMKPRDISSFQAILDRSPFSLPTAEESSPLAERYSLTGAADLNGDPLVFVLDRTTQSRQMLSKIPNSQKMSLVEYLPDTDPRKMRATIRVDGQIATIAYSDTAAQPQQPQQPGQPQMPAQPQMPGAPVSQPRPSHAGMVPGQPTTVVNVPAAMPGSPAFQQQQGNGAQQPPRRVIRRRVISGQPAPGP